MSEYERDTNAMARLAEAKNEASLVGAHKLNLATAMIIRYTFAAFVAACVTAGWIFG